MTEFNYTTPPWPASRWLTIYSKPHAEFDVSDGLEQRGYPSLLPVCQVQVKRRDAKSPPIKPLFPRYLFVNVLQGVEWHPILSVPGVNSLLSFGRDRPVTVPDAIIVELIQRLRKGGGVIPLQPKRIKPGARCQVMAGPLAGHVGLFVGSDDERTRLMLEILGQSSLTVVPNGVVRPLEPLGNPAL